MKKSVPVLKTVFLSAVCFGFAACNDSGGDSGPAPVGPDISGQWEGVYYRENSSKRVAIHAEIQQEGDAVVINTDKTSPPAQHFTGRISNDGDMVLTDASDGETWTTHRGAATTEHVQIMDFLWTPEAGEPTPPMQIVDLHRATG